MLRNVIIAIGVRISCPDLQNSTALSPGALPATPVQPENELPVGGKSERLHFVSWLKLQSVVPLFSAQPQN